MSYLQVGGTGADFDLGTKYSPNRDFTIRGKVNNKSVVSFLISCLSTDTCLFRSLLPLLTTSPLLLNSLCRPNSNSDLENPTSSVSDWNSSHLTKLSRCCSFSYSAA